MGVVVGDGDGSQVGEKGDEDDEIWSNGLVEDDHREGEVDLEVNAKSNSVFHVGLHPLEDLSRRLDGENDRAEAGREEDDICCGLRCFRRAFHSDTTIGLLERRGVVDTCDTVVSTNTS